MLVDVVGIAGVVVDLAQGGLQVEAGVGIGGADGDGDHGQAISHAIGQNSAMGRAGARLTRTE